jgi:GntR family transcriptional regulator
MLLRIDLSGDRPLYRQICSELRRAVRDGDVAVGERLPAARDLARSLDVNMHTVLRAYRELAGEGIVDLRRGRGAVVRSDGGGLAALKDLIVRLADEAEHQGIGPAEVVRMIREEMP